MAAVEEEEKKKTLPPLPPPPTTTTALPLPFPSWTSLLEANEGGLPPSSIPLEEGAWDHLNELLAQSITNSKLSSIPTGGVDWLESFTECLHSLDSLLTPSALSSIAESRIALSKAHLLLSSLSPDPTSSSSSKARDKKSSSSKEKDKEKEKGKEKEKDTTTTTKDEEKEKARMRVQKEQELKQARELLFESAGTTPPSVGGSPATFSSSLPPLASTSTLPTLSIQEPDSTSTSVPEPSPSIDNPADDSAWTTVAALPKLTRFRLKIRVTTTTPGAVKGGLKTLGVRFEPNEWDEDSVPLFGKDEKDEPDEESLSSLTTIGGTFHLTSVSKDSTKLSRVLELLSFALLTLKLESHLMYDLQSPRPSLLDDVSSITSFTSTSLSHSQSQSDLPSESPYPDSSPSTSPNSIYGNHTRSKWSSSGLWSFLTNTLAPPSTTFSFHPHSPPSSPGKKIKDKLKDKFALRRSRSTKSGKSGERRRREGSSSATIIGGGNGDQSVEVDALDAWDYLGGLGLGLGIGGGTEKEVVQFVKEDVKDITKEGKKEEEEPAERFQRVIKQMERCLLSVSPNVVYPPPHLLIRLRQQEISQLSFLPPSSPPLSLSPPPPPPKPFPLSPSPSPNPQQQRPLMDRLRSYTTIDAQTLAMGFASDQVSVDGVGGSEIGGQGTMRTTTSRATRITLDARAGLASLMTNNNSLSGAIRHQGMQFLIETTPNTLGGPSSAPCKPPKWLSFSYFSHLPPSSQSQPSSSPPTSSAPDITLGQLVESLVEGKDEVCEMVGCKKKGEDHTVHWMHSKECISIRVSTIPSPLSTSLPIPTSEPNSTRPKITTWTICRTCHSMTEVRVLSLASYLFSFSKLCELLIYDPGFVPVPELCEHSGVERNVLVRCFAVGNTVVSVELDQIELFELRLPTSVDPDVVHELPKSEEPDTSYVDILRLEINSFFQSVFTGLDVLEERLQSADPISTIKASKLSAAEDDSVNGTRGRSESTATIQERVPIDEGEHFGTLKDDLSTQRLLRNLRHGFEDDEADLLSLLDHLPPTHLNNVRGSFWSKSKAIKSRLSAWEQKHLSSLLTTAEPLPLGTHSFAEPEYFQPGTYAFPVDSSVLVRENEISSAIALTLSAPAFQEEVSMPSVGGQGSRRVTPMSSSNFGGGGPTSPATSRKSSRQPIPLELFEPLPTPVGLAPPVDGGLSSPLLPLPATTPPRSPRPGSIQVNHHHSSSSPPDPDDPTANFEVPLDIECHAKPKKEPRSGSLILGMRGAIGRQASTEGSFGFFRGSPLPTPSTDGGPQLGLGGAEDKRKALTDSVLEDLVTTSETLTPSLSSSRNNKTPNSTRLPQIISGVSKRTAPTPKATVPDSVEAELTPAEARGSISSLSSLESKNVSTASISSASLVGEDEEEDHGEEANDLAAPLDGPERPGSRLVSALWNLPQSIRRPGFASPRQGDSGHIKFCFRQGDKYFRVTAYFAQRFQTLRAQCGLSESLFIESLSRCYDLKPSGGKSKAAFFMTEDRRFMLKELTTMWGVSEKDAFINFAPELLNYLMTPERPSLLAKIFGFYTIKVRNLKTGETKKLDVVVLEHLFHSQTITRQFDLKGVASRVAKPKAGAPETSTTTGWDADWLSSHENRLLIYSHSKTLLRDALLNDSNFLSKAGNIDYSLLVGVDDSKKELVCGLIDTLGVFNTLKMLENAGKTVVKKVTASDTESVTVLPPADYAARFRQGLETAFVAVPEKFSRIRGQEEVESDPRLASPL